MLKYSCNFIFGLLRLIILNYLEVNLRSIDLEKLKKELVLQLNSNRIIDIICENNLIPFLSGISLDHNKTIFLNSFFGDTLKKSLGKIRLRFITRIGLAISGLLFNKNFLSLHDIISEYIDDKRSTLSSLNCSNIFWQNVCCLIKVSTKPNKKTKYKRIFIFAVDDKTTSQQLNDIMNFAQYVASGRIKESRLVIISNYKISFADKTLVLDELDEIDQDFIETFSLDLLKAIQDKDYLRAIEILGENIVKNDNCNIDQMNVLLQCLAFCHSRLTKIQISSLFRMTDIDADGSSLFSCQKNHLIYEKSDQPFYDFCHIYLETLYQKTNSFSLVKLSDFLIKLKEDKEFKSEHYLVFLLSRKIGSKSLIEDALTANFYAENLSFIVDEIDVTRTYIDSNNDLVLSLYRKVKHQNDLDFEKEYSKILDWVDKSHIRDVTKLILLYYLVNDVFKYEFNPERLLDLYASLLARTIYVIDDELSLLFASNFLLYTMVLEDRKCLSRYDPFLNRTIKPFIEKNIDPLYITPVTLKMLRCANGIFRENYIRAYPLLVAAVKNSEDYPYLNLLASINLGVGEINLGNYASAKIIYDKLFTNKLVRCDNNLWATVVNNSLVADHLSSAFSFNEKSKTAKNLLSRLKDIKSCSEEFKHLQYNFLSMRLARGNLEAYQEMQNALSIEQDLYFSFFLRHNLMVFETLYLDRIQTEKFTEYSVFFTDREGFFEKKFSCLDSYVGKNKKSLADLREYLRANVYRDRENLPNYAYLLEPFLFSLCERWFE